MLIEKVIKVGAMATVKGNVQALMKRLTIIPTGYEGEANQPLHLYRLNKDGTIDIPRALVVTSGLAIEGSWKDIPITFTGELRPKQKDIVDRFNESRQVNRYGSIIKANTGEGKTIVGLYLASLFKGKTLVVVPLEALVQQWKERILEFTDVKESEIGIIRSDTCQVKGKKIVIAMIHSLSQREYPGIYNEFKLVIFDEVHVLGATTFSKVAGLFNSLYRIGLSATPRRKDGAENVFLWHIGAVITGQLKRDIVPTIYVDRYRGEDSKETYHTTPYGKFLFSRYLNHIAKQPQRNMYIASLIRKMYEKDRTILVLTDRVNHVAILKKLLDKAGITDISILIGNRKDPPRGIILATYGSAGMGVDIPQLDTLIFATPRVDIEQAVGRLLRIHDGKKNPLVIDIVDINSKNMIGYYQARRRHYHKLGFKVVDNG